MVCKKKVLSKFSTRFSVENHGYIASTKLLHVKKSCIELIDRVNVIVGILFLLFYYFAKFYVLFFI